MTDKEKIAEILMAYTKKYGIMASRVILEEYAEELVEKGIVVPPCKVGDTVYRVMADKRIKRPYKYKIIGFWYSADETCNNLHLVRYVNGVFESSMSVPFTEFNRILFLTKKEAEQALKEREQV